MSEKIPANEISFREMSEEEAVKEFQSDGYFDYKKRTMRYGKYLSPDSNWATAPARMFVAYYEDKPVAVIGLAKFKNALLMAGTHVRKEYRRSGLSQILIDEMLENKGSKTIYANPVSATFGKKLRDSGFKNMEKETLPKEIQEELRGINYPEQLQKWVKLDSPKWMAVLKKFTPLEEMEEWVQVFIKSIYEMQGKLDRASGREWFAITNLIQKISYMGEGAKHKDIMKLLREIVKIIDTNYDKKVKQELEEIIQRRKEELYE